MGTHKTSDFDALGIRLQQLAAGICVLRLAIETGDLDNLHAVSHLYALEDVTEELRDDLIAFGTGIGNTARHGASPVPVNSPELSEGDARDHAASAKGVPSCRDV